MSRRRTVGFALIGAGWIGRLHAEQIQRLNAFPIEGVDVRLQVLAEPDSAAAAAASAFGFPRVVSDWREAVNAADVSVVDVCVPNFLHREIVEESAAAGKHVFCEKPLSTSSHESERMVECVEAAGVVNMINFNYRRAPAIAYSKQLVESGALGTIHHFRSSFSQDFGLQPDLRSTWRFDAARAGGGSLTTLGSHALDCARFLVGEVRAVSGLQQAVDGDRLAAETDPPSRPIDDTTTALLDFSTGAVGTLDSTWVAHGRKHHFEWELHGSHGSLAFNSERLNELRFADGSRSLATRGFTTIYMGPEHFAGTLLGLKAGMGIGIRETFLLQLRAMVEAVAARTDAEPSFRDGLHTDRLIDAIHASATERRWVSVGMTASRSA